MLNCDTIIDIATVISALCAVAMTARGFRLW